MATDEKRVDLSEVLQAGISDDQFDANCDQLFSQQVVKFNSRANNPVDEKIEELISIIGCTIPILHIKENIYLVGSEKLPLQVIQDIVFVQIPTGAKEQFVNYVPRTHRYHE